jgi:uncharacterized membrane-anchored protein
MHLRHMPAVNTRYWLAIAVASVFGTNLGDLYAHNSGLGLIGGLPILIVLAAAIAFFARKDPTGREIWYWLLIVVIRTGATNIADYSKHQIPYAVFGAIISIILVGSVALSLTMDGRDTDPERHARTMPTTGAMYWIAMLSAGVFGTFFGDVTQHWIGQAPAAFLCFALFAVAFALWRMFGARHLWIYWLTLAVARTAGTAGGDFLAENKMLAIGLPLSTLGTGVILLLLLLLWPQTSGRLSGASHALGAA